MTIAAKTMGLAAAVMWSAAVWRQELPDGQGKELTMRLCGVECHGIDKIISEHRSKSQWIESIETMKQDGMKGTDAEFKAILSYLVAHFGVTVKINEATARKIDDVLDLEPGQAEAIVKYREANGPFADWKALMAVPGLDSKKLEEQKANVVFSDANS
jgi:competence ComEA-like helix-hairpin-helix protein